MGGRGGGSPNASALGQAQVAADISPASTDDRAFADVVSELSARPIINRQGLNQGPINLATLSEVRDRLAAQGWTRGRQDAAISRLAKDRKVTLIPQSNQKVLTPKERAAAFRQGNEDMHLIQLAR